VTGPRAADGARAPRDLRWVVDRGSVTLAATRGTAGPSQAALRSGAVCARRGVRIAALRALPPEVGGSCSRLATHSPHCSGGWQTLRRA